MFKHGDTNLISISMINLVQGDNCRKFFICEGIYDLLDGSI